VFAELGGHPIATERVRWHLALHRSQSAPDPRRIPMQASPTFAASAADAQKAWSMTHNQLPHAYPVPHFSMEG